MSSANPSKDHGEMVPDPVHRIFSLDQLIQIMEGIEDVMLGAYHVLAGFPDFFTYGSAELDPGDFLKHIVRILHHGDYRGSDGGS